MRGRTAPGPVRPHMPGYGIRSGGRRSVTGTALVFGTGPRSRKASNISVGLRMVAYLENGDDFVIFAGIVGEKT